jgi:hypothetical protein
MELSLSLVLPSPSFWRHLLFSHKFQQVCTWVRPPLKDITRSRCIFNYRLMQSPSSANALDLRPYPTRMFVVVVLIHVPPIHFSHIPITPLLSLSLSLAFSSSLPF